MTATGATCITRVLVVAAAVLALDVAKAPARNALVHAVPVTSWSRLVLSTNTGAALSLGADSGITPTQAAAAAALVVIAVLGSSRMTSRGWVVIVGGAAGNLIDRLLRTPGLRRQLVKSGPCSQLGRPDGHRAANPR